MTIRLLPALLVLGALPAVAQPSPKQAQAPPPEWPIPVLAAWSVGDSRFVELVEGKRRFADGALTGADSSTTTLRILVTEAGDDYYRVRWLFEDFESSSERAGPELDLDERLLLRLYEEGYSIRTDGHGTFQQVENGALLRRLMDATFEGLLQARASETDGAAEAAVRELLERTGGVDHLVGQMLAPVELYYALYGYEWNVGGHGPFEDELHFGSRIVPVLQTVKVSELDKSGTFTLTVHLVAEPASLSEVLMQVISPLLDAAGETEPGWEEEAQPSLTLRDVTHYLIDAVEGWVLGLDWLRMIEMGEVSLEKYFRLRTLSD
jgi:hypothetical protein